MDCTQVVGSFFKKNVSITSLHVGFLGRHLHPIFNFMSYSVHKSSLYHGTPP